MPLGRAVPLICAALLALTVAACASALTASPDDAASSSTARMPREIVLGAVDMAIQRVEPDVSREEVAATIGPMIANAPVCMRWPALWIENVRRNSFVVRYDLMTRDWGQSAADAARGRMDEFVEMGFLQQESGADPQVAVYVLTALGESSLSGIVEPGRRPRFCAPAERRLVAITAMEWGEYPCGTLRVRFTHDGEAWPSWLRSEAARVRLAQSWPAEAAVAEGSVSLSRQWFRRRDLPPGAQNGGLRSACFDARRQEIVGDDLDLSIALVD